MDIKLHLLESFRARGSDGSSYKVMGYEHLARDLSIAVDSDRWEPTGVSEYRLEDGTRIDAAPDGSLRIAGSGVTLSRDAGGDNAMLRKH